MIPMPVIQIVGGILMAVALTNSSLGQINNQIKQRAIIQQEQIQEDIDELIDDYLEFEDEYIETWIEENDDVTELTEDDLIDIKGEALDCYINNEKYEYGNVRVNQRIIDNMKKQLPKPVQEFINKSQKYNIDGQSNVQRIIWFYLNYKNGDKFEWLRR